MSLDKKLQQLKSSATWHVEQSARARDRKRADKLHKDGALYFAVCGLRSEFSEPYVLASETDTLLTLRPVEEPPGEVALYGAVKEGTFVPNLARYSYATSWELTVYAHSRDAGMNLAFAFQMLTRLKTGANFVVPMVADASWGWMAAVNDRSLNVMLLDDYSSVCLKASDHLVTRGDLEWVTGNYKSWFSVWEMPKVNLALTSYYFSQHAPNLRVRTSALWSALESLFDVDREISFRMASYISVFLEPRGTSRYELYRKMVKMYGVRSQIVHGRNLEAEQLMLHDKHLDAIFRRVCCRIVEASAAPDHVALERQLFE